MSSDQQAKNNSKKLAPNLRLIAARVIDDVTQGRSLADCLEPQLKKMPDPRDRAFVQALCYGVCRFYTRLDIVLSRLLKKPMSAKDTDVYALLLVGLYQLIEMRVPPHAAVSETVDATVGLKKTWARGFVNAVLREYLRAAIPAKAGIHPEASDRPEMDSGVRQDDNRLRWDGGLLAEIANDPEAKYAHPDWWITQLKAAWPSDWEKILHENNQHPPFSLRVNQQHLSRDDYIEKLRVNDLAAKPILETACGIVLDSPVAVEALPGFAAGDVSVQDGAAQLAAELLDVRPNQRVLDACAAPGGKLMHMLEIEPTLEVVAVEKELSRIASIKDNLARLKFKAHCVCDDAVDVENWWDGKLFDRILLDAPCSASGVIRRHPDIKLLREPGDIKSLAREQAQLLAALWPLLKQDGLLVYATCSVFPAENTEILTAFLAAHSDAREEKIHAEWGVACQVGRQIFPGMHGMDGFYYARLRKL